MGTAERPPGVMGFTLTPDSLLWSSTWDSPGGLGVRLERASLVVQACRQSRYHCRGRVGRKLGGGSGNPTLRPDPSLKALSFWEKRQWDL